MASNIVNIIYPEKCPLQVGISTESWDILIPSMYLRYGEMSYTKDEHKSLALSVGNYNDKFEGLVERIERELGNHKSIKDNYIANMRMFWNYHMLCNFPSDPVLSYAGVLEVGTQKIGENNPYRHDNFNFWMYLTQKTKGKFEKRLMMDAQEKSKQHSIYITLNMLVSKFNDSLNFKKTSFR